MTPANYSSTVTIDSGAAALSLPPSIFTAIIDALPMDINLDNNGNLVVACKSAELDAELTIQLTGTNGKLASINVPMGNLVLPNYNGTYNSTALTYQGEEEMCVLALASGAADDNVSKPRTVWKTRIGTNPPS